MNPHRSTNHRRLSLLRLCAEGYWWCLACEHVTEPNLEGPVNACSRCGSSRIAYKAPAWSDNQEDTHENLEYVCNGAVVVLADRPSKWSRLAAGPAVGG